MFRIVQCCLNKGELVQDLLPQLLHFLTDLPLQLLDRCFPCKFILRMDQIHNGFRLGKIHAPVQKSSSCEFSGFGKAGTLMQHCVQQTAHNQRPSVALQLHNILSGKGLPPLHEPVRNAPYGWEPLRWLSRSSGLRPGLPPAAHPDR